MRKANEKNWKKAVVTSVLLLFRHYNEGTEENQEETETRLCQGRDMKGVTFESRQETLMPELAEIVRTLWRCLSLDAI
jgi:hypothetical protein